MAAIVSEGRTFPISLNRITFTRFVSLVKGISDPDFESMFGFVPHRICTRGEVLFLEPHAYKMGGLTEDGFETAVQNLLTYINRRE
ncbi:hypothetical protein COX05_01460 [candidate division WWE3 bacterium CG22_combo_CG10-13_8_21_14_all_39_12]|uniref:Uncharacterized protein n=2 Tax=Katanobacteria TaxID=422282 RepID=A0A2M7WZY6_UNCKA|nr:MAG: hypothetical protein COX05_01460 [candidate division WWE3 bacterium CG22_combo_CG10-13_8_21_14_all_39_12]PJA39282.1 MAG: hypothetical protein CO179_05595 [candidate division WWE3 bacterium CG_4_9_14_3_um_filter_39_7]